MAIQPHKEEGPYSKADETMARPLHHIKKINDLVYRIQLGPKCKQKVVHKHRLWRYTGNNVPSWNFDGMGSHKAKANLSEIDTTGMSEVSQSRPNQNSSSQTSATSKQNKAKTVNTTSQKQSSQGLRRSSRPRKAPIRYGQ